jgi:hypothetical protein
MAATRSVGVNTTFSTSTSSTQTGIFAKQSDTLRVVAEGAGVHVAIGTNPTATVDNYYVHTLDSSRISLGSVTTQRVVGITTGVKTTLNLPEGTSSPFVVGDAVSLTVDGVSNFNFEHKIVSEVNNYSRRDGYTTARVVVNHDSSSVTDVYNENNWAQLRESFKVAVKTESGTGKVFIQQVQVS